MKRLIKKALWDLFGVRSRLITAFLAVLIGMSVFGAFTFTRELINRQIEQVFAASDPASASLLVDRIDASLLKLLQQQDSIRTYEIGATHELAMKKADGTVKNVLLFGSVRSAQRRLNSLTLLGGSFPNKGEILLEGDALGVAGLSMNDSIDLELPDGTMETLRISGLVNDLSQHPPSMHNEVYGYVDEAQLEALGLAMNRIDILAAEQPRDREHILGLTQSLIEVLEQHGYSAGAVSISKTPGVSMHREEYRGALFIMQVFAAAAFIFGAMIMSSLFRTILGGKVREIGVLKAIGAGTGQITAAYTAAVALLVAVAAAVAFPLSLLMSRGLADFFLSLGNMKAADYMLPGYALAVYLGLSLAVPFLLAMMPVLKGVTVTVKAAISNYGISSGQRNKTIFHSTLFGRLPGTILYAVRCAAENRFRFVMNAVMLTLAGALFVGISSCIIAINGTISDSVGAAAYDYQILPAVGVQESEITAAMSGQSAVSEYEVWDYTAAQLVYPDGNTGNRYTLNAVPEDTEMFAPELIEGQWISPGTQGEAVVSHEFLKQEPAYRLGDTVTLAAGGQLIDVKITGVIREIGSSGIYLSESSFRNLIPPSVSRRSINIVTEGTGRRRSHYDGIREAAAAQGLKIVRAETRAEKMSILKGHYTTTLTSFLIVAVMVIFVAGFGLASAMSNQVNARTREIGIMKAIGAPHRKIFKMVAAESYFICLVSFVTCTLLGIPLAAAFTALIGQMVLELPLVLSLPAIIPAVLGWFLIALLVGRLASRRPAKAAAALTVHQALEM